MQIRVYYEDTDAGGVVYHTNYLKFCERARSEMLFSNGSSPEINNGFLMVKNLTANFIKPAVLGDIVEVKSEIIKLNGASMVLKQDIFRGDELMFSLNSTIVFVKDFKICRFDEDLKNILREVFGNKIGDGNS